MPPIEGSPSAREKRPFGRRSRRRSSHGKDHKIAVASFLFREIVDEEVITLLPTNLFPGQHQTASDAGNVHAAGARPSRTVQIHAQDGPWADLTAKSVVWTPVGMKGVTQNDPRTDSRVERHEGISGRSRQLSDPSTFLTDREVREATGLKRPTAQQRWFQRLGIHCARRSDGSALVLREHFVAVMSGGRRGFASRDREPDFSSLK
jgi:hypothetical protein